jgi:hypothetical protein
MLSASPDAARSSSVQTPSTRPSRSASAANAASSSRAVPRAAVPQHSLEKLRVDIPVPPRARRGKREPHRARLPTTDDPALDVDQATSHELLACLEVAALAQPGPCGGRRRPSERQLLAVCEARNRERHQPLTGGQVLAPEHSGDRGVAHHDPQKDEVLAVAWLNAIASTATGGARDDAQTEVSERTDRSSGLEVRPRSG